MVLLNSSRQGLPVYFADMIRLGPFFLFFLFGRAGGPPPPPLQ